MDLRRYASHAVFGAVDGLTVILGVMLPLLSDPHALVLAATGAAIAEAVGMGAGEWLSDSDGGWRESAVIGGATAAAAVLPAVPFMVARGAAAEASAAAAIVLIAAVLTLVRRTVQGKSVARAAAETYGILAAVALIVGVCSLLLGGA